MSEVGDRLRRAGIVDVLDDATNRAMYASDASLYRVVPQAVVRRVLEPGRRGVQEH